MEILKELEPKTVAMEFYIGDGLVRISPDCCKPREEVPGILRKIARDAQIAINAAYQQKEMERRRKEAEKAEA